MNDLDAANQELALMKRKEQLLSFKIMQLNHTNSQLLARLKDLMEQAKLVRHVNSHSEGDPPPPSLRIARKNPSA